MKKLIYTLLFVLTISCKVKEKPEYKALENIKVESLDKKAVVITADALFYNPNHLGGKVKKVDIDLFLDDIKVSDVSSTPFEINSRDTFRIPLRTQVPYGDLFGSNGNNLLGNLINAALKKKIEVHYKGVITLDLIAWEYNYALDEVLEIDLK